MKILSFLLFALCTAVLSQSTDSTVVTTDSTTTIVTESTTIEGTTTEEPITTTLPTTSAPETTTSAATTTTVAPSSTTTRQPVTTSPPVTTAFPDPEKCFWNVTSRDNEVCIRAELKVQFVIPIEGRKHYINLGCGASKVGSNNCSSNDTQTLVLVEPNQYNLTMVFEKKDTKFFVSNITFEYALPNGENGSVANNKENFNVKLGHSYLCRSETPVHLENVTMEISEIQIEAFAAKGQENFGSAEECDADDKVSDVVPIAVGVALATLIIIVLIAYLVGRRRSRQRGYQSV